MKKIIAATVAVVALAAAAPLVASAGDGDRRGGDARGHSAMGQHGMGGHHGMGRRDGRGPGGKIRMMELLETHDADGDGSVTQAEVDQHRADRLAEFDADNNGQLSLAEYEQLWLDAMRERMVDHFQGHDDDGDGQVTVEEFGERSRHMVMRMDRNEDGALSLEDLERRRGGRDRATPPAAARQQGASQQGATQQGAGQTEQQ